MLLGSAETDLRRQVVVPSHRQNQGRRVVQHHSPDDQSMPLVKLGGERDQFV